MSNGTTSSILLDFGGFKDLYVILVAFKSFNRWYKVIVNSGNNVSAVIIHWIPRVGLLSKGFLTRDQVKVQLLHNYNQVFNQKLFTWISHKKINLKCTTVLKSEVLFLSILFGGKSLLS